MPTHSNPGYLQNTFSSGNSRPWNHWFTKDPCSSSSSNPSASPIGSLFKSWIWHFSPLPHNYPSLSHCCVSPRLLKQLPKWPQWFYFCSAPVCSPPNSHHDLFHSKSLPVHNHSTDLQWNKNFQPQPLPFFSSLSLFQPNGQLTVPWTQ